MIDNYANKLFEESGLSYKDITPTAFNQLVEILKRELDVATKNNECNCSSMHVNRINSYFKADGSLWYGKITLASNYFNNRDAVTFYDDLDETISLCGWADDSNAAPIKKAFSEWVKYLEVNK